MRDSNSRHPRCKRGALPSELTAPFINDNQTNQKSPIFSNVLTYNKQYKKSNPAYKYSAGLR